MLKISLQCCGLLLGGEHLCSCASCTQALECIADPLRQGAAAGAPQLCPRMHARVREKEKQLLSQDKTKQGKAAVQGNAGDGDLASPDGSQWYSGGGCAFRPMI